MTTDVNATETTLRATAATIARAALFDDKITTGDKGRILAWAEALDPFGFDQADMIQAVTVYYQGNERGRTIQVADVIREARNIRRDRAEREKAREITSPPDEQLAGLPIGGGSGAPVWAAYEIDDVIDRPCPVCAAKPDEACVNIKTGDARKIPCIARLTGKTRLI